MADRFLILLDICVIVLATTTTMASAQIILPLPNSSAPSVSPSVTAPTSYTTKSPTTLAQSPSTSKPTQLPTTSKPTQIPMTSKPTESPTTQTPATMCSFCADGPINTNSIIPNDDQAICAQAQALAPTFTTDDPMCTMILEEEARCCPEPITVSSTIPSAPLQTAVCSFCAGGLPDPGLIIPNDAQATCAQAQAYAPTFTADDPMCTMILDAEALCCPSSVPSEPPTSNATTGMSTTSNTDGPPFPTTSKPTPITRSPMTPPTPTSAPITRSPIIPMTPSEPLRTAGLTVTLTSIESINNWPECEKTTASLFSDFYNDRPDLHAFTVVVSITDIVETRISRRNLRGSNDRRVLQSEPSVKVTYTQDLFYGIRKRSTWTDEQLAKYPLSTEANREKYVSSFRLLEGYEYLTEVSKISFSSVPVIPPEPLVGAIVGGAVAGLLVLALIGYVYYQKMKKDEDATDMDEDVMGSSVPLYGGYGVMGGDRTSSSLTPDKKSSDAFDIMSPSSAQDSTSTVTVDLDQSLEDDSGCEDGNGVMSPSAKSSQSVYYEDNDKESLDIFNAPTEKLAVIIETPDDGVAETSLVSDRKVDPDRKLMFKDDDDWGSYEGDVDESGNRQGNGKMTYENGSYYEGGFLDNKFHGKGVYHWTDGDEYEGTWKDGERHGVGIFRSADGAVEQYEMGNKGADTSHVGDDGVRASSSLDDNQAFEEKDENLGGDGVDDEMDASSAKDDQSYSSVDDDQDNKEKDESLDGDGVGDGASASSAENDQSYSSVDDDQDCEDNEKFADDVYASADELDEGIETLYDEAGFCSDGSSTSSAIYEDNEQFVDEYYTVVDPDDVIETPEDGVDVGSDGVSASSAEGDESASPVDHDEDLKDIGGVSRALEGNSDEGIDTQYIGDDGESASLAEENPSLSSVDDDQEFKEKDEYLGPEGNMDEGIDTQYMGGDGASASSADDNQSYLSVDDDQDNEDNEKFADEVSALIDKPNEGIEVPDDDAAVDFDEESSSSAEGDQSDDGQEYEDNDERSGFEA